MPSDQSTTGSEHQTGTWLGPLEGVELRDPGPDAEGPILELRGEEGMAAVEIRDEKFVGGLTHAAAEIGMVLDEVDSDE